MILSDKNRAQVDTFKNQLKSTLSQSNDLHLLPVAYAREGFRGHPPPPPPPLLTIKKEMKSSLFATIRFFFSREGCVFLCYIQLASYVILRNFDCDAIIPVVKLLECVALELMTDSKCNPGQGQWALLKQKSCCDVIKRLFSTAIAGQDNVSAQKALLEQNLRMVATQANVRLAMI